MATKKHVELIDTKLEKLEETVSHQKELITMLNNTLMNQKIVLEMIVSKLNANAPSQNDANTVADKSAQSPKKTGSDSIFPMNRRVMV